MIRRKKFEREKKTTILEWASTTRHIWIFLSNKKPCLQKTKQQRIAKKYANSAGFFSSSSSFLKCVVEALASIVFCRPCVRHPVKAIRPKITCMGVHRRRHETDARRSQITNIISWHLSESVVYTNTKQHTSEMHVVERKSHLCRCRCRRCELFCSDKIVPLVCGTFIPKCMLHTVSQCPIHLSRRLWLLFHVCCVHMRRRLRLRTRSAEWDAFFSLFILNCNRTLYSFRFTWKINTREKNYVNMWSSLTSSSLLSSRALPMPSSSRRQKCCCYGMRHTYHSFRFVVWRKCIHRGSMYVCFVYVWSGWVCEVRSGEMKDRDEVNNRDECETLATIKRGSN